MWDKGLDKGGYGYIKRLRKRTALISILFIVLSVVIFVVGFITTKTRRNYLSIVSAIGMLPAAKFLVLFLITFKIRPLSLDKYRKISNTLKLDNILFDLLYTSHELNIAINACYYAKNNILNIYTSDSKLDKRKAIDIIIADYNFINLDNKIKWKIQIYKDFERFILEMNKQIDDFDSELKSFILSKSL